MQMLRLIKPELRDQGAKVQLRANGKYFKINSNFIAKTLFEVNAALVK